MKILFSYLIFPGLLFSLCMGLFSAWIDKKITARVQWRAGPHWYHDLMELIKLSAKEVILPAKGSLVFLLAPFFACVCLIFAAVMLGRIMQSPVEGFSLDLIVLLFLLIIPSAALISGAIASGNPLALLGAARMLKLVLAYESAFILSVAAVIIKTRGSFQVGEIINYQMVFGSNIISLSGILAFVAAILCAQARLGFAPFDIVEADQEIMGGVLIEYSGLPLAIFKLTKMLLLYIMPVLLISLFWAKDTSPLFLAAKYIFILIIFILVKNTNPRLRIGQALGFFFGPVFLLSIAAVVLALLGK